MAGVPAEVPGRQTQIGEQIQRLDKAINRAWELRQALEERVIGILRNKCDPKEVQKSGRTPMVPVAEELATLSERVEGLGNGLNDILQRVEL